MIGYRPRRASWKAVLIALAALVVVIVILYAPGMIRAWGWV